MLKSLCCKMLPDKLRLIINQIDEHKKKRSKTTKYIVRKSNKCLFVFFFTNFITDQNQIKIEIREIHVQSALKHPVSEQQITTTRRRKKNLRKQLAWKFMYKTHS